MTGPCKTNDPRGVGPPLPSLLSHTDEARFWVSIADPAQVETYAWTCFNAMPKHRQTAFLAIIREGSQSGT